MELGIYLSIKADVMRAGYGYEIEWAEKVKAPETPEDFFGEYAWVVVNSGMKNRVARIIYDRISQAIKDGKPVNTAFKHPGKAVAIQHVWKKRQELFDKFKLLTGADEILSFCRSLPWIGEITQYHLSKNFGVDCAKPDRHLVRIAERYKTTPRELCEKLSKESGDRVATVDLVIWRACEMGFGYLVVNGDLWQENVGHQ